MWTNEEIKILEEEYKKRDGKKNNNLIKNLSKKLGKTEGAIRSKAYSLGITKRDKYYTKEEIDFLLKNYNNYSMNDLSELLGRNESNIYKKMKQLGIDKKKRVANIINPKKKHIYTEEERKNISQKAKIRIKEKGHPKGFENHKHIEETKKTISEKAKEQWKNIDFSKLEKRKLKQRETKIKNGTLNPMKNQSNPYSRTKGGKRKDLDNIYFRSAWEANIARYYNYLGIEWQYESKTFIFKNITRGSVSYTPDFYLPKEDKWVEIKGWMDGKSKTKLKRFEKQFPEEYKKLQLITQKEYDEIKKKISVFIKNWE